MRIFVLRMLGFLNTVFGTCGVIVGLLPIAFCVFLVFKAMQIPAPPPADLIPLFIFGASFAVPFGLVLYSGISLLRNKPKAVLAAVAACAVLALWGVLLIVVTDFAAELVHKEQAAGTRAESWRFATALWSYACITGLLLLLGLKPRRRAATPVDDSVEVVEI